MGCVLEVQSCLDLTTEAGREEYELAHSYVVAGIEAAAGSKSIPINGPPNADGDVLLRKLDNAVLTGLHHRRAEAGFEPYQLVRGAFQQGPALSPNSGFHKHSHVQLALTDFKCVVGWFLRPEDRLLDAAEFDAADSLLKAASVTRRKPRRRVTAS